MLPDQVTELLTAYVDGELSQRQRKTVMRVLHKSSEARDVLRQLQENAHKVKLLPFRKAEPSLVGAIMQAIAERQVQPKPAAPSRGARRRWLPYLAASLAASLLIAVLGVLYWKSMVDADGPAKNDMPFVKHEVPENKKPEPQPTPRTPKKAHPPLLDQIVQGAVDGALRQPPPLFSSSFADLKDAKTTGQLAREFDRVKALEFDIKVKSNSEALARLKEVLKDRGITLVADTSAAKPVNDKKVQYLVYADNVTSDELTKMMASLGETYVMPGTKNQKNMPSPYKNVTVTPIAEEDKQKLAKLLVKPDPKAERKAVVLPVNPADAPSSAAAAQFAQRPAPQAGTVQVLIRIRQD